MRRRYCGFRDEGLKDLAERGVTGIAASER